MCTSLNLEILSCFARVNNTRLLIFCYSFNPSHKNSSTFKRSVNSIMSDVNISVSPINLRQFVLMILKKGGTVYLIKLMEVTFLWQSSFLLFMFNAAIEHKESMFRNLISPFVSVKKSGFCEPINKKIKPIKPTER